MGYSDGEVESLGVQGLGPQGYTNSKVEGLEHRVESKPEPETLRVLHAIPK